MSPKRWAAPRIVYQSALSQCRNAGHRNVANLQQPIQRKMPNSTMRNCVECMKVASLEFRGLDAGERADQDGRRVNREA